LRLQVAQRSKPRGSLSDALAEAVMSMLTRKLLRDLWATKGQVVTIALVVASGIAAFVASLSTYESLKRMQADYYKSARFAHVFAHSALSGKCKPQNENNAKTKFLGSRLLHSHSAFSDRRKPQKNKAEKKKNL
jgi:hypothetical protein